MHRQLLTIPLVGLAGGAACSIVMLGAVACGQLKDGAVRAPGDADALAESHVAADGALRADATADAGAEATPRADGEASADEERESDGCGDGDGTDVAFDADSEAGSEEAGGSDDAACPDGGCSLHFVSDSTWESYSGTLNDGQSASYTLGQGLGPAREVCLNASIPAHCPTGALLYGYVGSGSQVWTGGDTIPSAAWIWRGDVAPSANAPMQVAIFKRDFDIPAQATGTIQIAVDDLALVFVNDQIVGSIGSLTDNGVAARAQNTLTAFDISSALRVGTNTVTVATEKGPFACGSTSSCPYSFVGAGVVFSGTLRW